MKVKLKTYLHHPGSLVVLLLTILSAVITVLALGSLIVYILVKGVPHLTPELFAWTYNSDNVYAAGVDQHIAVDAPCNCGGRTAWNLCSDLYGGICKEGK